jgi:peptide deformylase
MQLLTVVALTLLLGFWSRPSSKMVVISLSASTTPKKTNKKLPSTTRSERSESEISRRSCILVVGAAAASGAMTLFKSSSRSTTATASRVVENNDFQGTSLPLLSLDEASALSFQMEEEEEKDTSAKAVFPFAQWPDPLLRRPASHVNIPPPPLSSSEDDNDEQQILANDKTTTLLAAKLQSIARILQKTAHEKNAVGLAAQQCGIDVSMVYLNGQENNSAASTISSAFQKWWRTGILMPNEKDDSSSSGGGIFLLNPRIVNRSREADMLLWTEECLVLPPWFRATVLRDAWVTIEYESIFPSKNDDDDDDDSIFVTKQVTLHGELARAAQHEMQHDEGILILDHVDLTDLPAFMQDHEAQGHNERMQRAFSRAVAVPSTDRSTTLNPAMNMATTSRSTTPIV